MNQTIPLVDLKAQYESIQSDIDAAIRRVIAQTSFIMGPEVSQFEQAFAAFCHAAQCVGISSGTSALELTLRALNVGPDDEVITVSHTFIATAEAISAVGATPVFVDIDAATYTLDPAQLAAAITPATRAVIPVHIYGQPADMTRIMAGARAHDLPVIADAAQAHGATWNGRRAAALGDVACFSFYPGKNLGAYGDAGAIVTDDAELAQHVSMLRNHGRTEKYLHQIKGFGERMDALQAAILSAKLPHLEAWTAARQRLAARYDDLFAARLGDVIQAGELVTPAVAAQAAAAWHLYVVRTPARDKLQRFLRSRGVEAGIHYPIPLHLQPAYADLGYGKGDLPVTEAVADTCLSLPIFPEMTDTQQAHVVECVAAFFESQPAAAPALLHTGVAAA